MYFDPAKGMQGNIERSLDGMWRRKEEIESEEIQRKSDVESAEQLITDLYLDGVQAQQDITDLMLEVEELKARLDETDTTTETDAASIAEQMMQNALLQENALNEALRGRNAT